MIKNDISFRNVVVLILLSAIFLTLGCVSTQIDKSSDAEIWGGVATGMVDSTFEMSITRSEDEEDTFYVNGPLSWDIKKTAGGYGSGRMNGTLKGKIKDGILNAKIFGYVTVEGGSATVSGKMVGTFSNTRANGTWNFTARSVQLYPFSGEWSAEKATSSENK